MYSNTLVHLEHWREDFSLSSMATVVDLILIWLAYSCGACPVRNVKVKRALVTTLLIRVVQSGVPRVFDGKRAHRDELICVVCHMWLTVNSICAHNKFACVVHFLYAMTV